MVRGAIPLARNKSARSAAPLLRAVFLSLESRRRHTSSRPCASARHLFAQLRLGRGGRRRCPPLPDQFESGVAVPPFRICPQAPRPIRARSICAHLFLSATGLVGR